MKDRCTRINCRAGNNSSRAVIVIRVIILRLKAALGVILALGSESSLGLTHLVELGIALVICIILENLVLLVLQVLVLELLNHLLLLSATLAVLQVVHVKLVLKVIDVSVLLDVGTVETLKLSF